MGFASNLRQLIEKENVSQAELAKKIGVSQAFINQLVMGQKTPKLDVLVRMADYFGVTIDELVR